MSNDLKPHDLTLTEKVEALFNLKVSSQGSSIGILFPGKNEDMRLWMDYEDFMKFRQSIEQLILRECRIAEQTPVGDAIEIDVPLETMQFVLSKVRLQPKAIARRLLLPEWQVNKWIDGTADKYDLNIHIWRLKVLASLSRRYNWAVFLIKPDNLPGKKS